MDCSLPGSSAHGIFQARVLEWGAIAFSGARGYSSFLKVKQNSLKIGLEEETGHLGHLARHLLLGTRASPASSTSFEEPPGAGPDANKVSSGYPECTPSQICGASEVGPGQGAEDSSLPGLGEPSLPLSWRERAYRKWLSLLLLLGCRHFSRRVERKWLWGPTQAPTAGLPLTSGVTLDKFLKPSSSASQFSSSRKRDHGAALRIM